MFAIPTADDLVTYIKSFTGSSNDQEIKDCIFQAELAMRNIELPALRTDPYTTFGTVGANQLMPIPADMNKPILFFQQGQYGTPEVTTTATATGAQGQNTITLTSVPGEGLAIGMQVSGTGIAENTTIVLFTSSTELVLSNNNIGNVSGTLTFTSTAISSNSVSTGPWIVYDRIGDRDIITQGLIAQLYLSPVNVPAVIRGKFSEVGQNYQFLPYLAEGAQINLYYYKAWDLLFTPIYDGAVEVGTVQTNPVLQTWPEGYIYNTLSEYYIKRHSPEDAAIYKQKAIDAYKTVEDQNNLGKWSGGHTRLTSIFQPRRDRQYAVK
jgi:hypothetical protein